MSWHEPCHYQKCGTDSQLSSWQRPCSGSSNGNRRGQVITRRGTKATYAKATAHPVVVRFLWRRPDQEVWCLVTKVDHRVR